MIKKLIIILLINIIYSQGGWMISNRTHPELIWKTVKTKNFNIHFHNGLYDIALQGANIAEKIRPILMKQVGLDSLQKLDIVLTAEDEIPQGFVMRGTTHTFIWVNQNEMAVWSENEKWLRTVLAHELQHIIYNIVTKTWLPTPMNLLYEETPGWFIEGLAEYLTEKWRPGRFDISHKYHVLKNSLDKIKDPHNDGFSKLLYFGYRFGDSTLIQLLNHRDSLKLFNFPEAFKNTTNITVKQFEEDWRRQMNTYFFGLRSQKEDYEDIGNVYSLPMRYVNDFDWFENDTNKIAMVGRRNNKQGDYSLILAVRDTSKEKKVYNKRVKKQKNDSLIYIKPIWKIEELDYGRIHNNIKTSPDGKYIAYSKFGYGKKQSLSWDIYLVNLESKKKIRLTHSKYARNPCWSPDSKKISFVSHKNGSSNLFLLSIDNFESIERITNYSGDVQIITPAWSPLGDKIAYALSKEDGNMDIVVFDIENKEPVRITNESQVDYRPVWHPKGDKITYTSHSGMTPNFHTVDIITREKIQNTNVGDAIWTVGWNYDKSLITGLTLGDVDSARVVDIDPYRKAKNNKVVINPRYSSWRDKVPDYSIPNLDLMPDLVDSLVSEEYSFQKNIKHIATMIIPDVTGFLYNGAFTDVTGRHVLQSFVFSDWSNAYGGFGYLNATGKPIGGFWGFNFYKDALFEERIYNQNNDYLVEFFNGIQLFGYKNYNFGNIISSTHRFDYSINFFNRKIAIEPDTLDSFIDAKPESGGEGSLSLGYIFKRKRPEINRFYVPTNGYGIKVGANLVNKKFWGDFTYNHYNIDAFSNKKIGPIVLYGRARYELISGNPPNQETAGLVDIPSNYYLGTVIFGKEHMSPRGWAGFNLGSSAFMGSLELRSPSINFNFIEFLKIIRIGNLSFSLISDFGRVWESTNNDWIVTAGFETRLAIKLGDAPLLIYSLGIAQEIEKWSNNPEANGVDAYIRLALVNPF